LAPRRVFVRGSGCPHRITFVVAGHGRLHCALPSPPISFPTSAFRIQDAGVSYSTGRVSVAQSSRRYQRNSSPAYPVSRRPTLSTHHPNRTSSSDCSAGYFVHIAICQATYEAWAMNMSRLVRNYQHSQKCDGNQHFIQSSDVIKK